MYCCDNKTSVHIYEKLRAIFAHGGRLSGNRVTLSIFHNVVFCRHIHGKGKYISCIETISTIVEGRKVKGTSHSHKVLTYLLVVGRAVLFRSAVQKFISLIYTIFMAHSMELL